MKRNKIVFGASALLLFFTTFSADSLHAEEEFYCEVMSVEGTATVTNGTVSQKQLAEGDALQPEDLIEVGAGASLDLAYDREWNNVTRIEENSKLRIRSLYPTTVELQGGGVYAKLRALPKESSFSVQTPTAIASVRGTEYRTSYEGGETAVENVSDSDVFVYGLDADGAQQAEPVVIRRSEKTQIIARGLPPMGPRPMEARELQRAEGFRQRIEQKVNDNIAKGRFARIPDIKAIENRQRERGGPGTPLAGRMEGPGAKLTPEERLKQRDGRPGQPSTGGGPQEGQGRRERNIPQTISGDEARQAAQGVAGEGRREQPGPGNAAEKREEMRREGGSRLLDMPGAETHEGPKNGANIGEPLKMGQERRGNEMQMRAEQERRKQGASGQPFGPDPGRRPADGKREGMGNNGKPQPNRPAARQAPRPQKQP